MSTSATKGAEDLRNLANRFKAISEVAEYLEKLGNLENALSVAAVNRDEAFKETEKAVEQLNVLKAQITREEDNVTAAIATGKQAVANAHNEAESILKEANDAALKIENDAESGKAHILADIAGHRKSLEHVQFQIEEKTKDLQKLQDAIEKTKAQIAGL